MSGSQNLLTKTSRELRTADCTRQLSTDPTLELFRLLSCTANHITTLSRSNMSRSVRLSETHLIPSINYIIEY